jgi:signal transduction histidine kinase
VLIKELERRLHKKDQALATHKELLKDLNDMNEKLIKSEKMKSGFLSNIRNEINNPLSAILGISSKLMCEKDEKIGKLAQIISKEAFELDFQLRNIFAAAEIEACEVSVKPSRVFPEELINDVILYLSPKIEQKKVKVNLEPNSEVERINTDYYLLKAIIMNVLANAIEFSPVGALVSLKMVKNKEYLSVFISDSGKGIEREEISKAFIPFHQLENGTKKSHSGHGLGLSVVKEFLDKLGGAIIIDSQKNIFTTVELRINELPDEGFGDFISDECDMFNQENIL